MANIPDPITRKDQYLSYLTGNTDYYPIDPITREEKYLFYLCENGGIGGGSVTPEQIQQAVDAYLEENPVQPGATVEQAEQIERNKQDISSLSEDFVNLKEYHVDIERSGYGYYKGALVSFVTDDGWSTDITRFYDKVFNPLGVPCNSALICNRIGKGSVMMTVEQAKMLHDAGWTVGSHTWDDLVVTDAGVTINDIDESFKRASNWLAQNGLDYDIHIAPHGASTKDSDEVSRRYFKACFLCEDSFTNGAMDTTGIGTTFFDNYRIWRRSGIGDPNREGDYTKTKADMLEDIKYAVKHNLWVVFVMHSWKEIFDDNHSGISDLYDVVKYCVDNSIKVVNLRDGLRMKGNKVDVGSRAYDDTWNHVNSDGTSYVNEIKNLSPLPDNTTKKQYVKIATMYGKSGDIDFGCEFDFARINISNDYRNCIGHVTALFKSGGNQNTPCSAKEFYVNYDSMPTSGDIPLFVAVESYVLYGNQIELYVSPQVASNIVINNVKEIAKTKDTLFNFGFSNTYESITPTYKAEILPSMRIINGKPSQSFTSGEICYDKQNEKVYIAKKDGWNKWLELFTENNFLDFSYSDKLIVKFANSGTDGVTITYNLARYIKIGNFIYLQAKLIGTIEKSIVSGECTIENMPFKPILDTPLNMGIVSFPSKRPEYMHLTTDGVILTNLAPSSDFAQNTFNIVFSVAYISSN